VILAEAAAVTSAISGEASRRRATPFISLRPIGRNSCRRSARVVDVDHTAERTLPMTAWSVLASNSPSRTRDQSDVHAVVALNSSVTR
jgi:hypothetical protein